MTSFDSETKIFSGEEIPEIFHARLSLGQALLYQCSKFPEKVVQICYDDGLEITLKEMSKLMKNVATFLRNSGFRAGDVVGFCARNSSYLAPTALGCILLGLPISPVGVFLDVESIAKFYGETRPKLIFCDHDQISTIQNVLKRLNNDAQIISLSDKIDGFPHISDILATKSDSQEFPKHFGVDADEICVAILPSSGSTGTPKLCRISHAQMLQTHYIVNGFMYNTILLDFYQFFWIVGVSSIVRTILNLQTRIVTTNPFSAKICVDMIEKYKVNQLSLLPSHIISILQYLETKSADLSNVRMMYTGGWFISKKTIKAMESQMPNGRVLTTYGMTEASGAISRTPFDSPVSSAVGKLNTNVKVKILLENGSFGGIGDVGEILIKQPFHFIDYLNNKEQTKACLDEDSWVHTGDMGYFNEDLDLFIAGRRKFLIRCSNYLVNPEEIEKIIIDLPGVSKVCVIPVPDNNLYEAPGAVIEREKSSSLTEKDIKAAVSHLEYYKQLVAVIFVDKMPLTVTGKLNRNVTEKVALHLA